MRFSYCPHELSTFQPRIQIFVNSWQFVGFGWLRPESPRYCHEFTTICNNLLGNATRELRTSHQLVRNAPNACTNLARIYRNPLQFLTIHEISLTICIKRPNSCFLRISSKIIFMNIPLIAAVVLTIQPEYQNSCLYS